MNYFAVVGDAEAEQGLVALQKQDGSKVGTLQIAEAAERLLSEVHNRAIATQ